MNTLVKVWKPKYTKGWGPFTLGRDDCTSFDTWGELEVSIAHLNIKEPNL